jgi:uncharacterized protein YjgD (DUF1641 family)
METTTRSNGAPDLRKRLQDPEIRASLNHLLDRLDAIERAVDTVERLEEQLPTAFVMATDAFDEAATGAADRGVVLDERTREALRLAERLTEPRTVDVLTRLIDRLDRLEQLADLADRLPGAVATAADSVDDALTRAAERGVVLDERVGRGLRMLEALTEPTTAAALERVIGRAAEIERLTALAEQAPAALATAVDVFDAEADRLIDRGYNPEQVLRQAVAALGRLGELSQSDEFQTLLECGVLNPKTLQAVGSLGAALADSQQEAERGETPRRGLFGLLGALRDPDVQRTIGFLTGFARRFGRQLGR